MFEDTRTKTMKRTLAALMIGSLALTGFAGCGEESKVTDQTSASTPGGSTTVTKESSVKTTGDNPPPAPGGTTTP